MSAEDSYGLAGRELQKIKGFLVPFVESCSDISTRQLSSLVSYKYNVPSDTRLLPLTLDLLPVSLLVLSLPYFVVGYLGRTDRQGGGRED